MQKMLNFGKENWQVFSLSLVGIIILVIIILSISSSYKVELTCEDAEKIVLEKIQSGSVLKCELEHKNYEIEVLHKGFEYEFIVNGNTGEIKEFDSDFPE